MGSNNNLAQLGNCPIFSLKNHSTLTLRKRRREMAYMKVVSNWKLMPVGQMW